jgi:hypothetical protein
MKGLETDFELSFVEERVLDNEVCLSKTRVFMRLLHLTLALFNQTFFFF